MDPFSAEGGKCARLPATGAAKGPPLTSWVELLNIHNAFYQGQYEAVTDFDISSLSAENKTAAEVLQYRAQIAQGEAQTVLKALSNDADVHLKAIRQLAQYYAGQESNAIRGIEQLVEEQSENPTVQLLGGIILQASGKTEEALSLLSKHQGSLEAAALIVQIHLQQNRTDLALKEVQAARKWAQDSLLVNIAESWVGIRVGGERYQQAFYVFEEMAQAPSTSASKSLVSQAIAEIHLGRLPEAEVALQQAMQKDPKDSEAIANTLVLNILAGKSASEQHAALNAIEPRHPLLQDLQEKTEFFDQAATKYTAKVAS